MLKKLTFLKDVLSDGYVNERALMSAFSSTRTTATTTKEISKLVFWKGQCHDTAITLAKKEKQKKKKREKKERIKYNELTDKKS